MKKNKFKLFLISGIAETIYLVIYIALVVIGYKFLFATNNPAIQTAAMLSIIGCFPFMGIAAIQITLENYRNKNKMV